MANDSQGREPPRAAAKPAPAWLGKKVGRFRLLASLGQGAMGRVFRAEDTTLNRQVALKVLPSKLKSFDENEAVEQFIREARSAATLEHPHVVHIYEVNHTEKVWYIAMEMLEGGNLRELVKANGPMDMLRACQLTAEAAEALDYAHRAGIVHRDVKPANLMLTRAGRCKITDFGLARIDDANDSFRLDTENVGTPLYAAPEVSRGNRAEAPADIYSLGCTLYYLLTGKPPFFGKTAAEVVELHQTSLPPDLCKDRPDLPQSLAQAIDRAMAKDPAERFESAGQFAKVLRMHTIPVSGSGSSPNLMQVSGPMMNPVAHRPWDMRRVIIWGGLLAVAGVAGGAYLAIYYVGPHGGGVAPVLGVPAAAVAETPDEQGSAAAPQVEPPQASMVPAATFKATDTDKLLAIARGTNSDLAGKVVAVAGQIASIHPTSSGKSMRIDFVGADTEDGFCASCAPALAQTIQDGFGGKTVRIIGVPELHKERPEIRVDSMDQVQPGS